MTRPLHIRGALIWESNNEIQRDLYVDKGRIVESLPDDALVVDLEGYTIFPGLINAHDHLHMNHYPRTKFREVYNNAHEWGEDVNQRLDTEPYKSLRQMPLKDRLFIGGLKNLLCGATTVAHHDAPFKEMYHKDFPVRVLKNYGWAHSLHFNTPEEVQRSYHNTPKDWPWFIHLAEGTDEVAAGEYRKLKELGCLGLNTVIVHGVGLTDEDIADAVTRVRGLVWCFSSNHYLLGKSVDIYKWMEAGGRVGIGSDSRLTGVRELLDETQESASEMGPDRERAIIESLRSGESIFGLKDVGHLQPGAWADFFTIADGDICRRNIALIVFNGVPRIGNPDMMARFGDVGTVNATLDGAPKRIHVDLARRIHECSLKEPGLEVDELPKKRFWLI
jgi:hypothetical protein